MTEDRSSKRFAVLTAVVVVVALAGLLAVRVAAQAAATDAALAEAPPAPAANVPAPKDFDLADLPTPNCWGCSWKTVEPLDFQIDLDILAPLGDGKGNAALWFKDFARGGSRYQKGRGGYKSRVEEITVPNGKWSVLPRNDPLLLEAETWIDQATCRFYPDVWPVEGVETRIANLLMILDLAKSWVYHGKMANDPDV
ncbi:MAG: hypothetical protein R3344_09745, partial [Acidobacteriota bacterium]|nr:hypothetical protein [Acidobacteriota bacterium]